MPKILLIEDDKTFSRILEGFLGKNRFTVETAQDGKTGLRKFHDDHFDLVLLDYRLPDVNGLEMVPSFKKHAPSVPVI
ncbi:MAG: response regulator, partial [Cyclobacteriaceae bacterium]|nr:response regulator [Cyclobacteriaceae bacterium]